MLLVIVPGIQLLMRCTAAFTSSFNAIFEAQGDGSDGNFLGLLIKVSVMTMGEPDTDLIADNQMAIFIFIRLIWKAESCGSKNSVSSFEILGRDINNQAQDF